jgi:prepilin-type N-terminal cleavage/methylation domain-containing protein
MKKRSTPGGGDDAGFTLIELLIVIVLLGVLSTVVVFAVGGITDRGTTAACRADGRALETAVSAYFAETGRATIDGATPLAIRDACCGELHEQGFHEVPFVHTTWSG